MPTSSPTLHVVVVVASLTDQDVVSRSLGVVQEEQVAWESPIRGRGRRHPLPNRSLHRRTLSPVPRRQSQSRRLHRRKSHQSSPRSLTKSFPSPPMRRSRPGPPSIASFPGPPFNMSSPAQLGDDVVGPRRPGCCQLRRSLPTISLPRPPHMVRCQSRHGYGRH